SVSWLAGANELVSIRPKDPSARRTVTLDNTQKNLIFTSTVFGLPLLTLLTGAFMWWRRR
ncbi:MAG: ABC transporter, partial [Chloroflexota bacterium]|nr:ABC transporter [Chloroflexota bacterium]